MYKNYFKVTIRNIRKHKAYALINILGLAVGITSCLLIVVHISYQMTFDKHIPDANSIYRMVNEYEPGKLGAWTPALLVKQMREDYPEIETGVRISGLFPAVFEVGREFITQEDGMIADSTIFEVFPTQFLAGTPQAALNEPNTVVLTRSVAHKLFGKEDVLGEVIVNNGYQYRVSGVVIDQPKNTTIPYKFIMAIPHEEWATNGWWTGNNFFSYVKLREGSDLIGLELKIPEFVRKYISAEILQFYKGYDSWDDYLADGNHKSFKFIPLLDIHLNHPRLSLGRAGNKDHVITFSIIAFFILTIACINYINMSTARSALRAKEVGMRKVMGSVRKSLILQFLIESMIITLFAVILGILISVGILPYFNQLTQMDYEWMILFTGQSVLWLVGIILIIGLLAGSYPAFYLSSFKPITALHGEVAKGGNSKIRTGLVVFQFAISVFLITGTFIVFQQISHMSTRELGLNTDQIFVIKNGNKLEDKYEAFRTELLAQSAIRQVGALSHYPSGGVPDWGYQTVGENPVTLDPDNLFADEHALQTLGLELVRGNFFSGIASDTGAVIINESFVEEAGWEDPIGQMVERGDDRKFRVTGVVRDFVIRSGKRTVRPLIFRYTTDLTEVSFSSGPFIHIEIQGDYQETLTFLENKWNTFVQGYPFDGFFLDDSFDRLYNSERRFGRLFTTFSVLAILIASIGLFALAAFTLERRMKEIAIRKVLGASASRVMYVIVWDFLKLIIAGALIAIPVSYYLGNDWLNGFEYRISIQPHLFIIPIMIVGLIAILTVGYKSYVTAMDNPVNALKQE